LLGDAHSKDEHIHLADICQAAEILYSYCVE
jgi:acetylornithine deacetylase/succinyl-diaminopimelate desuccinylase-like protein